MELLPHYLLDVVALLHLGRKLLESWNEHLANLPIQHVSLLLENRGQRLFNLLLDELWQCSSDRLRDGGFHLELNVLLARDLLVELVELGVQICILFV